MGEIIILIIAILFGISTIFLLLKGMIAIVCAEKSHGAKNDRRKNLCDRQGLSIDRQGSGREC
jgi:hypothetical protein